MDENSWKPLLSQALAILDDLRDRGFGVPDVVLGGGTVLMMRLRHRLSKNVDLFLHDAQWLRSLSPRLNDRAGARAAGYDEQANSLKLRLDAGDIDFVVAGEVSGAKPSERLDFAGWSLPLESSVEILAKKLYFRAGLLKPRDAFDLVAAHRATPEAALVAVRAAAPRRPELERRLRSLAALAPDTLRADISPLEGFEDLASTMIPEALALIESAAP